MKNILLILLFISSNVLAQNSDWFEIGATWTYQYQKNGLLEPENHLAVFTITEQATLNGQPCAKMEAVGDNAHPLICNATQPPYYFYESNDSVFYASEYDQKFRLAYNFNAQPGDTWQFVEPVEIYGDSSVYTVTVNDVSTIIINGEELRVLTLFYQPNPGEWNSSGYGVKTVIEKIGGGSFFIPFGYWNVCEGHFYEFLRCYSDSQTEYFADGYSSCVLGVKDMISESKFNLYPNPALDNFRIESFNESIQRVDVYNIYGQLLYSEKPTTQNAQINISGFKSGIYPVVIYTNSGSATKKLVVNKE